MLSLVRWQPKNPRNYPSDITFWVRPLGVLLEFWAAPTFKSIGDAIGETLEVDADMGRVRVVVDGFKELCFETSVDFTGGEFHDGEEAQITLKYEKLFGYCHNCYSLCHDQDHCPLFKKETGRKQVTREPSLGSVLRPLSYKGVVINGAEGRQDKGQEREEYLGKGNRKVFEEGESQWKKVADRGNRRIVNRSIHGIEKDGYRQRSYYREPSRNHAYDVQARYFRSQWREKSPPTIMELTYKIEEGVITLNGQGKYGNDHNREGSIVLSEIGELMSTREGETHIQSQVEEGMDFEVKQNNMGGNENVTVSEEEFQNLTDEVSESFGNIQEQSNELTDRGVLEIHELTERLGEVDPVEKKKTARKVLFKQATVAGGSTKKRLVQAPASPRKRHVTKPLVTRLGEASKNHEDKGPSIPKPPLSIHDDDGEEGQ